MVMIAGRRKMCELYTKAGQHVYSYRFDTRLWNKEVGVEGVQHFDNVAFSFQNISGLLGPSPGYDHHRRLARAVGMAYVRFVYSLDPNPKRRDSGNGEEGPDVDSAAAVLPYWPRYDLDKPQNMVLNASGPFVEADDFRREGINFLNSFEVARELLS